NCFINFFSPFEMSAETGIRWRKWVARFKKLMLALNIENQKRQRALLLHYGGESVNDIFDTLPDTVPGENDNALDKAIDALTAYFTHNQNIEHKVYVFRRAKQEQGENLAAYHTRLRKLAMTCNFMYVDREIKSQVIQTCLSAKLGRRALGDPGLTEIGKAMKVSEVQASSIEREQQIQAVQQYQ
uniref:Retrotransposon gag domain-containing protein n=1 Tax=Latimeria chalumnae TaxID=7897 RepID=H3BEZ3_LATCH